MQKILTMIIMILVLTSVPHSKGLGNGNESKIIVNTKDNKNNKKNKKKKTGWVKFKYIGVRKHPNKNSKIAGKLLYGKKVKYKKISRQWLEIKYHKKTRYVYNRHLSKKKLKAVIKDAPANNSIKSWMGYRAITNTGSLQYKLQHTKAYTGKYGIRQVHGRYCIALGSYYTRTIGQYVDIILNNETIMPCIIADCKADSDTDSRHIMHPDGSLVEFVVDTSVLNSNARRMGDISYANKKWMSRVKKVKIYNKRIKF